MILKAIYDHLKGHPAEYLLLLIVMFGVGWQGNAIAGFWVDGRIKTIVQAEMTPVKAQVTSVSADLANLQEGMNALLKSSLKREIMEIQTLLCATPGDRRLLQAYEDAQERYRAIAGERFSPPECSILRRM